MTPRRQTHVLDRSTPVIPGQKAGVHAAIRADLESEMIGVAPRVDADAVFRSAIGLRAATQKVFIHRNQSIAKVLLSLIS